MSIRHAAVWLDHQEAKVFHIDPESFERSDLQVTHHLREPHKIGGHAESHRSIAEDHPFFDQIAKHLADADEILVVGPANTKLEFMKFVQARHKDLAKKILGVEPSDHPTDGQLVAHVRKYFLAADRVRAAQV
jgi:stalled ribosome rescue protein Dom34